MVPNLSKSEKKSSVLALVPYYTDYWELDKVEFNGASFKIVMNMLKQHLHFLHEQDRNSFLSIRKASFPYFKINFAEDQTFTI